MTPELAVLVRAAAEAPVNGGSAAEGVPLPGRLEWSRLAALAETHGLTVRLGALLQRTPAVVPQELLAALAKEAAANARRNLEFTTRLQRVLSALHDAAVPALAYKGPVLAEALYGAQPLREFRDVDVLIEPRDWPRARDCLKALGLEPNQRFTPAQEAAYVRSNNEMAFDGWGARHWLEVEWGIVPRYFAVEFRMADLMARAAEVPLAGTPVRTLSPEDTLLTLVVHGSKHGWARLCWVADVADLLRVRTLDWSRVAAEAERMGIVRMLMVALRLAERLQPEAVEKAREGLRAHGAAGLLSSDATSERLADEFWHALQHRPGRYAADSWRFFVMMPRLRERWRDRVRFYWRLLVTPETGEWKAVSLPDALYPLYYPLRWLRLAVKPLLRVLR